MNTICNIWRLAALVEIQARLAVMSNEIDQAQAVGCMDAKPNQLNSALSRLAENLKSTVHCTKA